jgi:hypothetical protein
MVYQFKLPVTISPAKDTFRVGDTIWIENSFSDQIHNHKNNKAYKVENFDFKTTMVITDLNSLPPAISYPLPKIVTYKGTTTQNYIQSTAYEAIRIGYDYANGHYAYKAALIVEQKGTWCINFFSYHNTRKVDITACNDETLYMEYQTNGNAENNHDILPNAKDPEFSSLNLEDFNKIGGYCFHVVE